MPKGTNSDVLSVVAHLNRSRAVPAPTFNSPSPTFSFSTSKKDEEEIADQG